MAVVSAKGKLNPRGCYVLAANIVDGSLTLLIDFKLCTQPYATRTLLQKHLGLELDASAAEMLKACLDTELLDWSTFVYYLDRYLFLKDKLEKDRVGSALREAFSTKQIVKPTQNVDISKHGCRYCTCHWDEEAAYLASASGVTNWTFYYRENRIDRHYRKVSKIDPHYRKKAAEYKERISKKRKDSGSKGT